MDIAIWRGLPQRSLQNECIFLYIHSLHLLQVSSTNVGQEWHLQCIQIIMGFQNEISFQWND